MSLSVYEIARDNDIPWNCVEERKDGYIVERGERTRQRLKLATILRDKYGFKWEAIAILMRMRSHTTLMEQYNRAKRAAAQSHPPKESEAA